MVPFPVNLSDPLPRFQGHGIILDALDILCAQLTRDRFAIAKFLLKSVINVSLLSCSVCVSVCLSVCLSVCNSVRDVHDRAVYKLWP